MESLTDFINYFAVLLAPKQAQETPTGRLSTHLMHPYLSLSLVIKQASSDGSYKQCVCLRMSVDHILRRDPPCIDHEERISLTW